MPTIATDENLSVRTMRDEDAEYALIARWRSQPHVHQWWDPDDPPPDLERAREEYGPRARGEDRTTSCLIELDGRPIGYVQFYRWLDWPEDDATLDVRADPDTFGLDVFIGDPDLVGRGLGTRVVDLVCRYLERDRGALAVALTTERTNLRAQRAYEKAGFRKIREVLDTDTRDGERVWCWLMVRRTIPA